MTPDKQPSLFAVDAPPVEFHGSDYVEQRDRPRLQRQLDAVKDVMSDGLRYTVEQVYKALRKKYPDMRCQHTSVARQIRNLDYDKHHMGNGLYVYWLVREE